MERSIVWQHVLPGGGDGAGGIWHVASGVWRLLRRHICLPRHTNEAGTRSRRPPLPNLRLDARGIRPKTRNIALVRARQSAPPPPPSPPWRAAHAHMAMISYTGSGSVSRARHVIVEGRTPSRLIFSP